MPPRRRKPNLKTNIAPKKKLPAARSKRGAPQHPKPADRISAQEWARAILREPFFILDTETTGVGKRDEIVQLGIIDHEGNTVMNTLIKPNQSIPVGASDVHGIYDADVADAPSYADIYVQVSALLAGAPLVAYNMDFDWRMLLQTTALYQLPPIKTGTRHCAMKRYAQFWGDWNSYRNDYRWQKLGEAATQQGVDVLNAHDAVGDCVMTLGIMQKMAVVR
jgi:DNA polymerase-3 subunit epsilon